MTVLAAIKDGNKVWVGSDNQVTAYCMKMQLDSDQSKIWKPERELDIVIGHTGAVRDANIISTVDFPWIDAETRLMETPVNLKYIIRDVVPCMFKELENNGRLHIKDGMKSMDSCFVFAYKNQIYTISHNGTVLEHSEACFHGSGIYYATGAYDAIKDNESMTAREKLIYCIKAACEHDLYVNYPIVVMSTGDDPVEIIER